MSETIRARLTGRDFMVNALFPQKPSDKDLELFATAAKATMLAQHGPNLCEFRVQQRCMLEDPQMRWEACATMYEYEPIESS